MSRREIIEYGARALWRAIRADSVYDPKELDGLIPEVREKIIAASEATYEAFAEKIREMQAVK